MRIRPRKASSTRCRVSGADGTCRETMSDVETRSGSEAHMVIPSSAARASMSARRCGRSQGLDLDPERRGPFGHAQPHGAEAHDAQRGSEQPGGLAVGLLVPPPGAQVGDVVRYPSVDGEQQAHGQLGHGGGVPARHVGDEHPPRRRGRRVDGVRPGPGADDQREPVAGTEDGAGHLGAAYDEDVEPGDAVCELCLAQGGIDLAGVAARLELGDGRRPGASRRRVPASRTLPALGRAHRTGGVLVTVILRRTSAHRLEGSDVGTG